jgi:hypothetical protein
MSEYVYTPDSEEIEMTGDFIRVCSDKDLVECWKKASAEWDNKSVIILHRKICEAGRVTELIDAVKEENSFE